MDDPIVSNRHCLLFTEHSGNETVVILEDLSSNGTFVNEAIVGRNQRRELRDGDEVAVLDKARFVFKYPRTRSTSAFLQQYTLMDKLGKGHFAEVYLCVEKSTGSRYAVKIFTKTPGIEDRSKNEGLQQEIAVLMGVAHPNVLCLKESFNESNAVYLVLELAPKGELFNYIVAKQKLTESECRKLFTQLFQGVKYLVCSIKIRPPASQLPWLTNFKARQEHSSSRHQTGEYSLGRHRPPREDCRFRFGQDYWRGVLHYDALRNP